MSIHSQSKPNAKKSPVRKKTIEGAPVVSEVKPESSAGSRFGICVAAWAIPGLGHLLLGRKWRALVLFVAITSMFLLGLGMRGLIFHLNSPSYLHTLGFFGQLCVGLELPVAGFFGYSGGNTFFVSSDYGTAFLVAAGMLNVLALLDAYDISLGRKP